MDAEGARKLLRRLPHVAETMQWGANLVYWAGDKALGGKMFALINLDDEPRAEPAIQPGLRSAARTAVAKPKPVLSFYAGAERYAELLEHEGFCPAPYLARAHWIALLRWGDAARPLLEQLLRDAHTGVFARLPRRTRELLLTESSVAQRRPKRPHAL